MLLIVVSPLVEFWWPCCHHGPLLALYRIRRRRSSGCSSAKMVSAAAFSLNHGGHDAKEYGIMSSPGVTQPSLPISRLAWHRYLPKAITPLWIILSAHAALGLGTAAGGWRIVKTWAPGSKDPPFGGFCAETGGAGQSLAIRWDSVSTTIPSPGLVASAQPRGCRQCGGACETHSVAGI